MSLNSNATEKSRPVSWLTDVGIELADRLGRNIGLNQLLQLSLPGLKASRLKANKDTQAMDSYIIASI